MHSYLHHHTVPSDGTKFDSKYKQRQRDIFYGVLLNSKWRALDNSSWLLRLLIKISDKNYNLEMKGNKTPSQIRSSAVPWLMLPGLDDLHYFIALHLCWEQFWGTSTKHFIHF